MSLLRNFRFIINLVIAASSVVLLKKRNQRKRKRAAHWVHPYLAERKSKGRYATDFDDMVSGEKFFKENFHMSKNSFDQLFKLVEKDLAPKRNTRPKDGIPPKLKLGLVIEYLASGGLQRHLASCYRVSKQHMGSIIDQVCDAICRALSAYVADPCQESFLDVANGFNSRWNFPNCIGAIDGKHVSIKAPPNAGSIFYNYKGFHSLALMAICDASYRFTYLDVGAYGSEGDCNIFKESKFGTDVLHDRLDFPENATVNGVKLPFFYVADDAFPLCKRIIKPYKGEWRKRISSDSLYHTTFSASAGRPSDYGKYIRNVLKQYVNSNIGLEVALPLRYRISSGQFSSCTDGSREVRSTPFCTCRLLKIMDISYYLSSNPGDCLHGQRQGPNPHDGQKNKSESTSLLR